MGGSALPHITIEYSANLEPKLEIAKLVEKVHAAAAGTGVMELGGLRTRAARRDVYRVADGLSGNAFMFVVIRMRPGRTVEQRKLLGQTVFDVVSKHLDPLFETMEIALSLEIQLLDPEFTYRRNNLHNRLRAAG